MQTRKRKGEGLCISNHPRCNVISVSDTLRRKVIASVHVGSIFRVDCGTGGWVGGVSSSTPNCFHHVALVECALPCLKKRCHEHVCG